MPHSLSWTIRTSYHPGSSAEEIENEPEWTTGHEHRVGYRNRDGRWPGLTHDADEHYDTRTYSQDSGSNQQFISEAEKDLRALHGRVQKHELVNFRDLIKAEPDFHLRNPANRSLGWRYVLETTEDWVKNEENWPANVKRREKEEQSTKNKQSEEGEKGKKDGDSQMSNNGQSGKSKRAETSNVDQSNGDAGSNEEEDWKRQQGQGGKHHDAYATSDQHSDNDHKQQSEYDRLRQRYSPQEIALLRALQHEQTYRKSLRQNDGKMKSPQTKNRSAISIDEQDQFSPDNWLPRSSDLIRLTGKHPLNAEADLTKLFEAGLITPNELHYVRNHGSVPRLLWELHKLEVEVDGKTLTLSMDEMKHRFEAINIPVSLACDGNRRKELNMIRKSKGFNWGSGATGCVYWKGPLLRDVLLAAGVVEGDYTAEIGPRWVNFRGADEPSEGPYETCIPLAYAMDPQNDVLLPMEMNDVPLPPDHGYPIRLLIPGYVGGRCVKWLKKIWISDRENDSHYHIWDNRVLPSFITEKDGDFATTMFNHPDTACNEQNLNSVIVRPAQGEETPLSQAREGSTYRIAGYAYDGGGHEVQRVEVSLDGGKSWLYAIRKFPDYPIRHGNKFWTWLHWHVDVEIVHLLRAKSISVRAWNVFKNTQPEHPSWNTMGMMNNCWYVVKPEMKPATDGDMPSILFRHPCEPGTGDGGWMQPSEENKIANAKQEAGAPQKQFTRAEIEKHDKENDCWLVIDGKVYDATSVLSWHPGGKAAVLGHAGKVHQETTDEFASIHDDFAYQKLSECALGVVTEKAANFIKSTAEATAKEKARSQDKDKDVVLQKHRWVPVRLLDRKSMSEDTRAYTFGLPDGMKDLGLGTCQHLQLGFHMTDKMLIRSYTPTKPVLPDPSKSSKQPQTTNGSTSGETQSMQDGQGTFELVVKTYFPTSDQPGGAMSNILDCIPIGEEVEVRGPTGEIVYKGNGKFIVSDREVTFDKINLLVGGSGLTPGYALIARAVLGEGEQLQLRVIDANKSEKDILLREQLDHFEQKSDGRLKICHVLSHPSDDWKGVKGHVNGDIMKDNLFPPEEGTVTFLCGPPAMINAALKALRDWGFEEDRNVFGF